MFSGPQRNPFNFYALNKVEKSDSTYHLRVKPNELWVATLNDGKLINPTRKIYQPRPTRFSMRRPQTPTKKMIERELSPEQVTILEEQIKAFEIKQKEDDAKLASLKKIEHISDTVNFKPNSACFVFQHEFAVTTPKSKKTILGTEGAGPCLILILHNNEKTFLAHIDSGTDLTSININIQKMATDDTLAYLAGGTAKTKEMCADVVSLLYDNNITIAHADLIHDEKCPSSLAIDSRTGELISPVSTEHFAKSDDLAVRLMRTAGQFELSPLRECYDGTQDLKFSLGA